MDLRKVKSRPAGYLTSEEFGAEVGHVPQTIMYAFRRGRFSVDKLLWWDKGGQKALLIHEDQISFYRANCRSSKPGPKPRNAKKPAAPQLVEPKYDVEQFEDSADFGRLADRDPFSIYDPQLVKLYKEQLAVQKAKLELQKAQNKLLDSSEVAALWSSLAVQIRQSVLAIVPRLAARLAAETDAHKCRVMLQKEITEALTELSKFGERYQDDEDKNAD